MKKIILFLLLFFLFAPVFACLPLGKVFAAIDQNLYYGLKNNGEVKELQNFLISKNFLQGRATGNFLSMTFSAVKQYQASKGIKTSGYVGFLTRQAISADLSATSPAKPLKGTLDLTQNQSYQSQTVLSPQTNFKLADFSLTNNTTEPINIKTIETGLTVGSNLYIANVYVTNLYAVFGTSKTAILKNISYKNDWSVNLQLSIGQTIDLSLYGDIDSLIPLNSNINASLLVTGTTTVSSVAITSNSGTAFVGPNIIFGTESLTVSQDGSTPASKINAANQRIVAGIFKFTSTANSYNVSKLKFVIPGSRNVFLISGAALVDTSLQATLATSQIKNYYNQDSTFDFNVSIPVSQNSSKSLTIYYDLASVNDFGITNKSVAPVLIYAQAKDSSGTLIDGSAKDYSSTVGSSYGGIAIPNAGVTVNNEYVYKSIPTFTSEQIEGSASNYSNASIYKFDVSADKNGDVSIKQLIFKITINDPNKSNPSLNKFSFFKGDVDYTGSVEIGNIIGDNYVELLSNGGVGTGFTNNVVLIFNKEETIPAGKTQTYTLKAYTNNFINTSAGADSVSTYIPSDTDALNSNNYLRPIQLNFYDGLAQNFLDNTTTNSYNLLWSDKSAPGHNDSSNASSNDWYNGFEVLNFPLASQSVVAKQ